jgi:hypothetical protein
MSDISSRSVPLYASSLSFGYEVNFSVINLRPADQFCALSG